MKYQLYCNISNCPVMYPLKDNVSSFTAMYEHVLQYIIHIECIHPLYNVNVLESIYIYCNESIGSVMNP